MLTHQHRINVYFCNYMNIYRGCFIDLVFLKFFFTVTKKSILQASVRYNNVILDHSVLQGLIVQVKMCDRHIYRCLVVGPLYVSGLL